MQFATLVVMALASLAAADGVPRQVGRGNSTTAAAESTVYAPTTVTIQTKVPETTVYETGSAPTSEMASATHIGNGTSSYSGPMPTNATNLTSTAVPPVATGAAAALSPMGAAAGAIAVMAGVLGAL